MKDFIQRPNQSPLSWGQLLGAAPATPTPLARHHPQAALLVPAPWRCHSCHLPPVTQGTGGTSRPLRQTRRRFQGGEGAKANTDQTPPALPGPASRPPQPFHALIRGSSKLSPRLAASKPSVPGGPGLGAPVPSQILAVSPVFRHFGSSFQTTGALSGIVWLGSRISECSQLLDP